MLRDGTFQLGTVQEGKKQEQSLWYEGERKIHLAHANILTLSLRRRRICQTVGVWEVHAGHSTSRLSLPQPTYPQGFRQLLRLRDGRLWNGTQEKEV